MFANAGADGYYRTAYPSDILRALAPRVGTDLTAPERLSLLDDEWALVRAGRHTVGDYLTLAAGFGREHTSGVLDEVANRLSFVHDYLTTGATRTRFEAFVRTLLRPLFDELGFAGSPVRRPTTAGRCAPWSSPRSARSRTIRTSIAQARSAVDRALAGDAGARADAAQARSSRPRRARRRGAVRRASSAAAERATAPDERYRYLYALGEFRDPALIERGLAAGAHAAAAEPGHGALPRAFFATRTRATARWPFVKRALDGARAEGARSSAATPRSIALDGSFCDARSRDDITAFFAEHKLPAAARTLDQTIERINNCIALREKQTPAVQAWLARAVSAARRPRYRLGRDGSSSCAFAASSAEACALL